MLTRPSLDDHLTITHKIVYNR